MFSAKKTLVNHCSVLHVQNEVILVPDIKHALNLKQFVELGRLPLPVSLDALDEGNGVENVLLHHNTCWHKSCCSKFNITKLKRAQKQQANTSESIGTFLQNGHAKVFNVPLQYQPASFARNKDPKSPFTVFAFSVWIFEYVKLPWNCKMRSCWRNLVQVT